MRTRRARGLRANRAVNHAAVATTVNESQLVIPCSDRRWSSQLSSRGGYNAVASNWNVSLRYYLSPLVNRIYLPCVPCIAIRFIDIVKIFSPLPPSPISCHRHPRPLTTAHFSLSRPRRAPPRRDTVSGSPIFRRVPFRCDLNVAVAATATIFANHTSMEFDVYRYKYLICNGSFYENREKKHVFVACLHYIYYYVYYKFVRNMCTCIICNDRFYLRSDKVARKVEKTKHELYHICNIVLSHTTRYVLFNMYMYTHARVHMYII